MPFTDEFNRIRRHYANQYSDKAKADTFAFKEALTNNVPTFIEERKQKFKRLGI